MPNGYKAGTRPVDAPWWPRLLGELPSTDAVREIETFYHATGKGRMQETRVQRRPNPSENLLMFGIDRNHLVSKLRESKYVHRLIFDEVSEMDITSRDCVCEFWNKWDYRF